MGVYAAGVQPVLRSERNHEKSYRHREERRRKKHVRKLKFKDFVDKALGVKARVGNEM